jgi:hypothetical protein
MFFDLSAVNNCCARHSPPSLELSGKVELVVFALTFLTSTWYIKNPFLKAKIVEVTCYVLESQWVGV